MDDLRSATTLADLSPLPPTRCHLLKGDLAGKIAIDVGHPYRLIFQPDNNPLPLKEDGGLNI